MTSELNSVFDQIVHIILFKRILNWGITFARAALKRPQTTINDSKYMINFISPTNDSTNSKRKWTIREFFRWDIYVIANKAEYANAMWILLHHSLLFNCCDCYLSNSSSTIRLTIGMLLAPFRVKNGNRKFFGRQRERSRHFLRENFHILEFALHFLRLQYM